VRGSVRHYIERGKQRYIFGRRNGKEFGSGEGCVMSITARREFQQDSTATDKNPESKR
jgi:hypothetical protein